MNRHKTGLGAVNMLAEHNTKANLNKMLGFIEQAAEEDVELLVFPECALQGYLWMWDWEKKIYHQDEEMTNYFNRAAEPIPGPSSETISKSSRRYNMVIQFGAVERAKNGAKIALYNSAVIVGPQGIIGVHHKVHSPQEKVVFARGNSLSVHTTPVGPIGPMVCADLMYPESARVLTLKGADVLTLSSAWGLNPRTDEQGYRYDLLTRTNALMNAVWLVSSNQTGQAKRSDESCYGHSRIVDPMGNVISGTDYEEGLVTAKVDIKGKVALERSKLANRCPEAYTIIPMPAESLT